MGNFQLNNTQTAVYSCLCYFDVFDYPLKLSEVFEFSTLQINSTEVKTILDQLTELKLIKFQSGFYLLQQSSNEIIIKRQDAEMGFSANQNKIRRYAQFIAKFPFVESVSISGSCSKGLFDKESDVDYFIITKPNRLWLCRSILVAFKKLFLFNSKKYFCVNYFLSSDELEIPDRNVFVACEISTLLPVSNLSTFEKFLNFNNWVKDYLPNKKQHQQTFLKASQIIRPLFALLEWTLMGKLGESLDKICFKYTLATWQKKFTDFSKEDFDLNLRSKKNVSKHHPRGFQKKVLQEHQSRMSQLNILITE